MTRWLMMATVMVALNDTDAVLEKATEIRSRAVDKATMAVNECQSQLAAARQQRDPGRIRSLGQQLRSANANLAKVRRSKNEDYVEEATAELAALLERERQAEADMARARQQQARLEEIRKEGPLVLAGGSMYRSSTGTPYLNFEVQNVALEDVEAFEFKAELFNKFDEPVPYRGGDNVYRGSHQKVLAKSECRSVETMLPFQDTATVARVWVTRVKLANGQVWTQERDDASRRRRIIDAHMRE